MIIIKKGKYKLLKDFTVRKTISISQINAGTIITITQIDKDGRKVIGLPIIDDWVGWDMPVELIEEEDSNVYQRST